MCNMSKNLDKNRKEVISQLEELGLTNKEARVYVALLPYKDVGTSVIINITKLHGQFVYNALARLEDIGLVHHVIKNGRKKFTANSPKHILTLLDEKRLSAQAVIRQLESRFADSHKEDFTVYKGGSTFTNQQMELLHTTPKDSTVYVIASNTDSYMSLLESYGLADEFERMRKMKRIHIQYLGAKSQKEHLNSDEKKRVYWTYRTLPGQSLGKMAIEIWPTCVNFAIYNDPVFVFSLTNQEVIDGYREFFNTLWRLAG